MTVIVEGKTSFWLGAQATLVEDIQEYETAWAQPHIAHDQDLRWIMGRYVESGRPNLNGHVFALNDLPSAMATLPNKPLNMLHMQNRVVGHYVAAEMIDPKAATADAGSATQTPFMEALAAFYATYFPEQLDLVTRAHADGKLFYSMEAMPDSLTCTAPGCGRTFPFQGRMSPTYCAHLNRPGSAKVLNKPRFLGGGLIFPPAQPGWPNADVTSITAAMESHAESAALYDQIAHELPHLEARAWEAMMAQIVLLAESH